MFPRDPEHNSAYLSQKIFLKSEEFPPYVMRYLVLLLLTGCTSLGDLYVEAETCVDNCDEAWAAVERMEAAIARRDAENAICGAGLVRYTDQWGRTYCIDRDAVRGLFGQW